MPTCFVIQPFDGGKFDKRFRDTFQPAIEAAELEAYRVDRDTGAEVLITSIEDGIRSAAVCLADITTDNPNVWYELGFALATNKQVVMICSNERAGKFPFDIQHRQITKYGTDSSSDFESLKGMITRRLQAAISRDASLRQIAAAEPVAPMDGLTPIELTVLALTAGSSYSPDDAAAYWNVRNDAQKAGLSNIGFSLGLIGLKAKQFIKDEAAADHDGESQEGLLVTHAGWDWISANESRFTLRNLRDEEIELPTSKISDDDIPF